MGSSSTIIYGAALLLLCRGIAELGHDHVPLQRFILNGKARRRRRGYGMIDVARSSNGGTRGSLGADEKEEDETYRDSSADEDATGGLPVRHLGAEVRDDGEMLDEIQRPFAQMETKTRLGKREEFEVGGAFEGKLSIRRAPGIT